MRRATKTPSEWLKLLCSKWVAENEILVSQVDEKFLNFKSYLNGQLSSQLLCRLSILADENDSNGQQDTANQTKPLDFWATLGIEDEFDRNYIVAQIEKFCLLYSVRGKNSFLEEDSLSENQAGVGTPMVDPAGLTGSLTVSPDTPSLTFSNIAGINPTAAAAAAAAVATAALSSETKMSKKQQAEVNRAKRKAKSAEKALEQERRLNLKRAQQQKNNERRSQKMRERDATNVRKGKYFEKNKMGLISFVLTFYNFDQK